MSEPLPVHGSALVRGFFGLNNNFHRFSLRRRVLIGQLPLTLSTVVVVLLLLFIDPALTVANPLVVSGLAGIALLTVAGAAIPWDRFPPVAYWTIPLLDFVPIGLLFYGANQVLLGVSLLCVFPIMWLAWSEVSPRATVVVAVVAPLLMQWAPFVLGQAAPTRQAMVRPLILPLVMLGLALATTFVTRNAAVQARQLAEVGESSRSRARTLNAILNVADVGVVVVDKDGHDVLMNDRQKAFHALAVPPGNPDPDETQLLLFGRDGTTPLPPGERPVRRAVLGEDFSGDLLWLGAPGSQRAVAASARSMHDDAGRYDGAVVVFHDVTEIMEAMAAQEEFVSSVSHEFRTPLTSIIGYLDLLLDDDLLPGQDRYLLVIQRNAERLLQLVSDLLDAASNGMTLNRRHGDLAGVVASAVATAGPAASAAGVRLELAGAPTLPANFDAVRMGQAIDNLVSNAIKYSGGSGVVTIEATDEPHWVSISVLDQGIGMSARERDGLFSRFYRTAAVRRSAVPGVGLGLSITKAIVEAHGGTITVDSVEGRGSSFTIRLPKSVGVAGG